MLQGESHVTRGQIRSLCSSTCHMSRQPERSHKKDNIESLGRLCAIGNEETKLLPYADDMTATLSDINSLQALLDFLASL